MINATVDEAHGTRYCGYSWYRTRSREMFTVITRNFALSLGTVAGRRVERVLAVGERDTERGSAQ
jgi:hypothetical protein